MFHKRMNHIFPYFGNTDELGYNENPNYYDQILLFQLK